MTPSTWHHRSADAIPLGGLCGRRGEPVAILGAGGTLGVALAATLRRCGVPNVALQRGECDITRTQDLHWLVHDLAPACIVNCAAITDWHLCERDEQLCNEVNGISVARLASACRARATPLVHFSCASVFDGTSLHPYRVDDTSRPLCRYGRSKELGENYLRRLSPDSWLLVRTSWLFGELSRDFVGCLLARATERQAIGVADDRIGSPTFADDLARAVLLLMVAGASGIWHLSNSGTATWFTFAQAIVRAWDCSTLVWPCETTGDDQVLPIRAAELPRSSVLDCSNTYRRLGLRMRSWEPALMAYCRRARASAQ
jgi:dTDP-4-dehydrorhamnose reductase